MPRSTRRQSGQRRRQGRRPELHPRPGAPAAADPSTDGGLAQEPSPRRPGPREHAGAIRGAAQRQAAPGPQARIETSQTDPLLSKEMRRIGLLAGGVLVLLAALALLLR